MRCAEINPPEYDETEISDEGIPTDADDMPDAAMA